MIFTIIRGVLIYVRFPGFADLPGAFSHWLTSLEMSPMLIPVMILLAYAVPGMFMEAIIIALLVALPRMENGGLEAMVYELMHWNPTQVGLTWDSLRYPPVTEHLRQQAGMGLHGPAERLVAILENGVLEGRTGDGDVFHYDLCEDEPVKVARHHLVAALNTNGERGNR